ncbi:MAG: cation transporter [Candidatus Izemoplasmatales bacterium]
MKTTLQIEGMKCMHCQKHIEQALILINGVTKVEVNYKTKFAQVESKDVISDADFTSAIEAAGYQVTHISAK